MKRRCTRCGEEKHEDDFAGPFNSRARKDVYCRPCRADYGREHYIKNRDQYVKNARRRSDAELDRRYKLLADYLREHPCVDCGETDPVVLEFDHLGNKSFNVAYGMRARTWDAVLDEMRKCEVVCANCHKRRTAARVGSRRLRMTDSEVRPKLFP